MARANSLWTRVSFPMPRACRRSRQAQQQKGAGGEEEEGTGGQGEDGAGGDKGGYDWLGRGGPGRDSREKVRKKRGRRGGNLR